MQVSSRANSKSSQAHSGKLSSLLMLVAIIAASASTTGFAAESGSNQIASVVTHQMSAEKKADAKMMQKDDANKTSAMGASSEDSDIGAYSSEDGAMLGAYGDGEYGD